jgi:hypothetical protein
VVKPDLSLSPAFQTIEFSSSIKFAKIECFAEKTKTDINQFSIENEGSVASVKEMWQQAIDGNLCTGQEIP